MPKSPSKRDALLAAIEAQLPAVSDRAVVFHHAVAESVGLAASDVKCLRIAGGEKDVTPGRLAELTGLTTGAVTGVVDRLEKAGFVRREHDPADRRRVLIRVLPDRMGELYAIFQPLAKSSRTLLETYDDRELAVILDFITRAPQLVFEETRKLNSKRENR
jgi:DNA-binding MarR family transcriptional regulator